MRPCTRVEDVVCRRIVLRREILQADGIAQVVLQREIARAPLGAQAARVGAAAMARLRKFELAVYHKRRGRE